MVLSAQGFCQETAVHFQDLHPSVYLLDIMFLNYYESG